jgi:GH25 family lysozyme M1 (1,4-beta-N-acetylmuramidase)
MTDKPWIMDISRYQSSPANVEKKQTINWQRAWDAGIRVVAIRCTVGDYYVDPMFEVNWNGAVDQGMAVTVYHVIKSSRPYKAQMEWLFKALGYRLTDIPIVLDCELTDNMNTVTVTADIHSARGYIADKDRRLPIIYTRQSWWDFYVSKWSGWQECDLWVAWYPYGELATIPSGRIPRDWKEWKFWQYSAGGNGKGGEYGCDSKDIDLSRYNGTIADFNARYGTAIPVPNGGGTIPPAGELSDHDRLDILWREAQAHGWQLKSNQ